MTVGLYTHVSSDIKSQKKKKMKSPFHQNLELNTRFGYSFRLVPKYVLMVSFWSRGIGTGYIAVFAQDSSLPTKFLNLHERTRFRPP